MRRVLALLALPCALALAAAAPALAANPVPPAVTTGAVKDVTQTTATLTGSVDPKGTATTYHVEYGTSDSYGLSTAEKSAGSASGSTDVEAAVTGLTNATTYHYRVVATNSAGVTRGVDRTFATASPATRPRGQHGRHTQHAAGQHDADRLAGPARRCDDLPLRVRHAARSYGASHAGPGRRRQRAAHGHRGARRV